MFLSLALTLQNMLHRCDCRLKASARGGERHKNEKGKNFFFERVNEELLFFFLFWTVRFFALSHQDPLAVRLALLSLLTGQC